MIYKDLFFRQYLLANYGETMEITKCDECGGKVVKKEVDFKLYGEILGKFPTFVCSKCGEEIFDEETSDKIDEAAKKKGL